MANKQGLHAPGRHVVSNGDSGQRSWANRCAGLVVAVAAVLFLVLIIPNHSSPAEFGLLRPRTLPTICAIALIGLGLLHAALPQGVLALNGRQAVRVVLIVFIGAISLWAMPQLGFPLIAPALVLLLMLLAGERRLFWLFCGALVTPASIWFITTVLLGRPLP